MTFDEITHNCRILLIDPDELIPSSQPKKAREVMNFYIQGGYGLLGYEGENRGWEYLTKHYTMPERAYSICVENGPEDLLFSGKPLVYITSTMSVTNNFEDVNSETRVITYKEWKEESRKFAHLFLAKHLNII